MEKSDAVSRKNYSDMQLVEIRATVGSMSPAKMREILLPQVENDVAKIMERYGNPNTYKGDMREADILKLLKITDVTDAVLGSEVAKEEYLSYEKAAEELEFKKIDFKTGKRNYDHEKGETVKALFYNKIPGTAFYRARTIGNYAGTLLSACNNTRNLHQSLMKEKNVQTRRYS